MKINKCIATIMLALLTGSTTAMAKSVVFTLRSGAQVYYLLGGERNPVMKVVDGHVWVNADEYEIADIKNFYVSTTDDPNAIAQLTAQLESRWNGHTLVLRTSVSEVRVASIDGKLLDNIRTDRMGEYLSIDMASLPQGIYIIKVGDTAIKVRRK